MKLYNKTKYPDALLESLILEAGKSVNARTSNVVVKVTTTKAGNYGVRGYARKCDYVYKWFLYPRDNSKNGIINTDGGYFRIIIPNPKVPDYINKAVRQAWLKSHCADGLSIAEIIYKISAHEWQHIKQYQQNSFNFRDKHERNKNHDNRIWERDADRASKRALSSVNDRKQDSILNLAIWIDSQINGDTN